MDLDGNPFRPNGELAKEANEIVNLIKQGKPISPSVSPVCNESAKNSQTKQDLTDSNSKKKNKDKKKCKNDAEEIEVNKSIVTNKECSFAEHVILPEDDKKKKDSLCCVIQ